MNEIYGLILKAIDKKAFEDYNELRVDFSKAGDKAMAGIASELIKNYLIEIYMENSNIIEDIDYRFTLFNILNLVKK
ncbi:MAG: hypothetical protein JEZ05_03025 [Tenericutes bacterium]|nr:hypothetical protein [Mycoplasmatota bacterium]